VVSGRYARDPALGVPIVGEGQSSEGLGGGEDYASSDGGVTKEAEMAVRFASGAVETLADGAPEPHVEPHWCGVDLSGDTIARRYYGRRVDTEAPLFSPYWRNQALFRMES
jgi:hypothetical protein